MSFPNFEAGSDLDLDRSFDFVVDNISQLDREWLKDSFLEEAEKHPSSDPESLCRIVLARSDVPSKFSNYTAADIVFDKFVNDARPAVEAVKTVIEQQKELEKSLSEQREKVKKHNFYTDLEYGAEKEIESFFDLQSAELEEASPREKQEILSRHAQEISQLQHSMEALDAINPSVPEHFGDLLVHYWDKGNTSFRQAISARKPEDIRAALKEIQQASDKIEAEYEKFLTAQNYLRRPETISRTVSHLFDTEAEPDSIDAEKLQKMLAHSSHLGLSLDPKIQGYISDKLLGNYLNRVKNQYRTKLDINNSLVDGTYADILRLGLEKRFKTREEYDQFIAQNMREKLPEFYADRTKHQVKMLPDSVWDSKRQQRENQADRNWETYLENGESEVWVRLDERLNMAKKEKFSDRAAYIKFLKETTKNLSAEKYIPDDVWDLRIKDRFKDRVENQWQGRLDHGSKEAQKIVDALFKRAEKQTFGSFEALQKYLRLTTAQLDKNKTVPDDYWQAEMRPAFHAREKALWARMDITKKKDSKAVEKAMFKVSLAPGKITGKPKTEADFFRLAKAQLSSSVKGRLTDADWDSHMQAYFYPHLKAQLKKNEGLVSAAMKIFAPPTLEDRLQCSNEASYLRMVKQRFSDQNQNIMGLIPNAQYDKLRDRILVSRGREQWRSHERSESLQFREAQGALNSDNLLRTVHHFAKNKKNPNPTLADIKSSSSHALAAQFSLRPDQVKVLDKDLKIYAAQALELHKTKRQSALKTIDRYKAPDNRTFTDSELKTSATFYDAMVAAAGYMNFTHPDDWYLVETEAMNHIENMRQEQKALETSVAANDNLTAANDNTNSEEETAKTQTEKSEELKAEVVENDGKHPAEQTEWMKRFGIPTESVSQKGVERFSRIMNLPEFNLGGIPRSDLKIAMPALVNMLGGFRATTWKNFTLRLRTDMRALDNRDPQSRFFQIIKSFATGYPYKLTDFDVVPGIDNVFNNLIKRTKNPEGEKFTTIKNLYKHYFRLEDREALDVEITEDEFESQMLELLNEDGEMIEADDLMVETTDLIEETMEVEPEESLKVESAEAELPPVTVELDSSEEVTKETEEAEAVEVLSIEPTELTETKVESLETGVVSEIPTETIDAGVGGDDQTGEPAIVEPETSGEVLAEEPEEEVATEIDLEPAEATDIETAIQPEPTEVGILAEESEETAGVTEKLATKESVTNPDEAYNDYLKEGAVVLTEVDQILRTPVSTEEESEAQAEEALLEEQIIAQEIEEMRPEEQKTPIDEAAEVIPDKLHKALLKLSSMGLLSDEAISWLLEQSMEFAVVESETHLTLGQALRLMEVSLQSQFLARNLDFSVALNASTQSKIVTNLVSFFQDFIAQTQAVDGLQSVTVNAHRSGALRGYFSTRFGKKSFAVNCRLIRAKKASNKLS